MATRTKHAVTPRRARTISPERLAAKRVQDAFTDNICRTPDTPEDLFDQIIGEVADAFEKAHVREHGPIQDHDTEEYVVFGQRAGYLVGVQVGLRLRTAGGAR